MKFTVAKKMILGFGLVLLILLAMMGFAYYQVNSINRTYQDLLNNRVKKVNLVHQMIESCKNAQLAVRGFLLLGNETSITAFHNAESEYQKVSQELAPMLQRQTSKNLFSEMDQNIKEYFQLSEQAIFFKKENNSSGLLQTLKEGSKSVADFGQKATQIVKMQESEIAKTQSDTMAQVRTIQWNLLIFSVFALALGGVIAIYIGRNISIPVKKIALAAKKIASGDLTDEHIRIKSKDEIGDLAHSFNDMTQNLRQVLNQIHTSAEQVAAASEELFATTEQTTEATNQICSAIQEVAGGAEAQVTSSKESASSMEEVTAGTQRIAESVSTVRDSAQEASLLSEQGNESIQKVIHQMDKIEQDTGNMSKTVELLKKRSFEIGNIIEVINGITEQTNLLALNAAIEAARAGEHGKGFAVVADEVRNLADQSRSSAGQIVELIKEIQKETETVNQEMAENTKEVGQGKVLIHHTGKVFQQIRQAVEQVNGEVQEVSAASEQISANAQQVTASVEQLSAIAKEAAERSQHVAASSQEQLASIEEITASSQSLSQLAEEFQELTRKFKI